MSKLPNSCQLLHLSSLDSTNEQARRMAEDGVRAPHWILADQQTAGRGRRGRAWSSPTGNLMTTLYLPVNMPADEAGQLAFVAGLALHRTVVSLVGEEPEVRLKWPNDVLINGAKVSGILLESALSKSNQLDWLAIGLGLNLEHYPEDTPYPASSVKAIVGSAPDNLQALHVLAAAFDHFYLQWKSTGFAAILTAWRQVAQNIGQPITARLETEDVNGIFEDIDENGALILRGEDAQRRIISAADIFFQD
ncbi:biotin--[acetyl-CoA-carboxylase] ligase [Alphaproteobacteria bacterium]|nr:biotin--[acetyl-CoA-carboxylase] ligase [Alphaproteobacteria bacterium]